MSTAIVITSGKGGTGKTSLTAGVGSCLAALGKRVLCIDMDIGLPDQIPHGVLAQRFRRQSHRRGDKAETLDHRVGNRRLLQ